MESNDIVDAYLGFPVYYRFRAFHAFVEGENVQGESMKELEKNIDKALKAAVVSREEDAIVLTSYSDTKWVTLRGVSSGTGHALITACGEKSTTGWGARILNPAHPRSGEIILLADKIKGAQMALENLQEEMYSLANKISFSAEIPKSSNPADMSRDLWDKFDAAGKEASA